MINALFGRCHMKAVGTDHMYVRRRRGSYKVAAAVVVVSGQTRAMQQPNTLKAPCNQSVCVARMQQCVCVTVCVELAALYVAAESVAAIDNRHSIVRNAQPTHLLCLSCKDSSSRESFPSQMRAAPPLAIGVARAPCIPRCSTSHPTRNENGCVKFASKIVFFHHIF